jgi:3',5'-cyclic AMP phosphodiesterase CpdA
MNSIRLALCSDTHFWPRASQCFGATGSQLQPWSVEIQEVLLADLAAVRPDLLFHLGDFTCGGGSFAMPATVFTPTLAALIDALRGVGAGFYGLPGNHDFLVGGDWSYAEGLLRLRSGQGYTIDTPMARLVLLNAQGHSAEQLAAAAPGDPTWGWVNEAELQRLEAALAGAGGRPVLLFSHQLLLPWQGEPPWADLYGIQNVDAVLALLKRFGNVRAIFQGHAHRLDVQPKRLGGHPCWSVVLPPVIEFPMAWLELVLHPDSLQVQLRRLPLADLAERSRQSGASDWRAGKAEWRNFAIPLAKE